MGVDIDWSLGLNRTNPMQALMEGQQEGQERAYRQNIMQRQQRQDMLADQAAATRRQALGAYGRGDAAGARQTALGAGDVDTLKVIESMDESQRAQAAKRAEIAGKAAFTWKQLPQERRRDALVGMAPQLLEQGFTPDHLRKVDLTDNGLQALIDQASTFTSLIERTKPDWKERTRADGGSDLVNVNDPNFQRAPASTPTTTPPGPQAPGTPVQAAPDDVDALTRMLYTEALGDGEEGMAAAGHVALNRLRSRHGGAKSLRDVVYAKHQFEGMTSPRANVSPNDPGYQRARQVAEALLAGQIPDPTGGAVNFINPDLQADLGRKQPAWAPQGGGQRIGRHVFYGGRQGDPQDVQPYQVASVGVTPPPPVQPGVVSWDAPKPKAVEWTPDGKGNLVNVNGDRKRDPTAPGGGEESALPVETGLTPIGDPSHGVYRNAVGQKFQTNRAGTIQRLGGPTDEMVGKTETKIQAINETLTLVDAVDAQLAKTRTLGPGGRYIVNQQELARLDSLTKQLQIAYKNAAELGAITGPDVPFIEAVAPNPREFRALIQRGEFKPRLESLAKVAGAKYRAQTASFRALGGDPSGLTPLYRSPRSKVEYDREGNITQRAKPAGKAAPPQNRVAGKTYDTPRGPMKWTGTGWVQP